MKSAHSFRFFVIGLALALAAALPGRLLAADGQPVGLDPVPGAPSEDPASADIPADPPPPAADEPRASAPQAEAAVIEHSSSGDEAPDQREQQIFDRVKGIVKKLDAANGKEVEFPSKAIETAMRAEFMRRTENKEGIAWLRSRKLRDADRSVALDNMELLLTYTEKLISMNKKSAKKGKELAKDQLEMKLLAAKSVIDRYNMARRGERGIASLTPAQGLSATGKSELARRRKLVAGMVGGEDYSAVQLKKIDEYAKRYRALLTSSVQEYEKLASAMSSSGGAGTKKAKKK